MQVLADSGFHGPGGDPGNLLLCRRGKWNVRMMVETVLSMMTRCCNAKRMAHRTGTHFATKLAFMVAEFNIPVGWNGLLPEENRFVRLSIADLIPWSHPRTPVPVAYSNEVVLGFLNRAPAGPQSDT